MAEQYLLRVLATQKEMGYPVGIAGSDFEEAVQAVAKWTAKLRRLAELQITPAATGADTPEASGAGID